jgi:hypothetical protein
MPRRPQPHRLTSSIHKLRWHRLALAGVLLVLAGLGILAIRRPASPAHTAAPDPPRLAVITPGAGGQPPMPTGSCGPSRWISGVPMGWALSRTGAVAAAAGYAKTMSTLWFMTDRDRRHQAIRLLATPGRMASLTASQDHLADQLAVLLGGPDGGGNHTVLTTALLGYRVDSFTGDKARVALWAVVVHGSEVGASLAPAWTTSTLDLAWIGGDWKLASAMTAPGPGPVSQPDAGLVGAPASLITAARTFREFTDVPA